MYSVLLISLVGQVAADCATNCNNCGAVPNNSAWATDSDCAQCSPSYQWWPCNVQGACQCADSTTSQPQTSDSTTSQPQTSDSTTAQPQTTASPSTSSGNDSICDGCSAGCEAVPGNHAVMNCQCEQCDGSQNWWPCNKPGLCQCKSSDNTTTGAPVTTAPATTEAPVTTAPATTEAPVTTAAPEPIDDGNEIKGYYMWSWNEPTAGPQDTNLSVFFSGWNSWSQAQEDFVSDTMSTMQGKKYFSIGGGNHHGLLNAQNVAAFVNDIQAVKNKGFVGVIWDIEVVHGSASSMNPIFESAFAAIKNAGLENGITVSHTAPYDTNTPKDGTDFVTAFVKSQNVDFMSPQLYSNGDESHPDLSVTGNCSSAGCGWDLYAQMRSGMKLLPSIVATNQYQQAKDSLKTKFSLECQGYFVWAQSNRRLSDTIIV